MRVAEDETEEEREGWGGKATHSGERERERERENKGAGMKKKWVVHHLPLDTLPSGNQSEWLSKNDRDAKRSTLQYRGTDVCEVKRCFSGSRFCSGGFVPAV